MNYYLCFTFKDDLIRIKLSLKYVRGNQKKKEIEFVNQSPPSFAFGFPPSPFADLLELRCEAAKVRNTIFSISRTPVRKIGALRYHFIELNIKYISI